MPALASPWTFMGDLRIRNADQMRGVAFVLYDQIQGIDEQDAIQSRVFKGKPCVLNDVEKRRVASMLVEIEEPENTLLREMTTWFAKQWNADNKTIKAAAVTLNTRATRAVRYPHVYKVLYERDRLLWKELLGESTYNGPDTQPGTRSRPLRAKPKVVQDQKDVETESAESIPEPQNYTSDHEFVPTRPRKLRLNTIYRPPRTAVKNAGETRANAIPENTSQSSRSTELEQTNEMADSQQHHLDSEHESLPASTDFNFDTVKLSAAILEPSPGDVAKSPQKVEKSLTEMNSNPDGTSLRDHDRGEYGASYGGELTFDYDTNSSTFYSPVATTPVKDHCLSALPTELQVAEQESMTIQDLKDPVSEDENSLFIPESHKTSKYEFVANKSRRMKELGEKGEGSEGVEDGAIALKGESLDFVTETATVQSYFGSEALALTKPNPTKSQVLKKKDGTGSEARSECEQSTTPSKNSGNPKRKHRVQTPKSKATVFKIPTFPKLGLSKRKASNSSLPMSPSPPPSSSRGKTRPKKKSHMEKPTTETAIAQQDFENNHRQASERTRKNKKAAEPIDGGMEATGNLPETKPGSAQKARKKKIPTPEIDTGDGWNIFDAEIIPHPGRTRSKQLNNLSRYGF